MIEQMLGLLRHRCQQRREIGVLARVSHGAKTRSKRIHCATNPSIARRACGLSIIRQRDLANVGGGLELAGRGRAEQLGVRHRVPQEIRKAAGDPVLARGAVRTVFEMEQEARRLQHRLDNDLGSGQEVLLLRGGLGEEHAIAGRLLGGQRPPERLQAELANELVTARGIAWRRRLAWHQSLRVAVAKCLRGKLFARDRVGFGQDRRNALTLRLIGEAVE